MKPLQLAIDTFGLAGIGALYDPPITAQAVHKWSVVPADRCQAIEKAMESRVTCEELRPDLSWIRIPDESWPNPAGRPLVDHFNKKAA